MAEIIHEIRKCCVKFDQHRPHFKVLPNQCASVFSSPVRKYRKSYCNHPGVGVGVRVRVRVAQMLKFLIKVFIRLYLLNMLMDQVDTLHVGRYWSEVLCNTIMAHRG